MKCCKNHVHNPQRAAAFPPVLTAARGVSQSQTGRAFHVFSASYWSGKQEPTEYFLGSLVATGADGEVLYQQNLEP